MALVLADRVKESTTTTGTGTVTLLGAAPGFQSFAVIGNTNTTYYTIAGQTTSEWEVGIGTYTSAGTLLARTTVLSNSAGTQPSALSFSAGTKDVFVTYPSSKSVNLDASGNATALGTPASGVVTNLTGTASININGTVGATTANTGAFTTLSATGVTTVQAGTAALPAITTTGDTNTGIWFPAADTIAFTEGGVESMRIDSSGNVGIGTSAPGERLVIQGSTTNVIAQIRNSSTVNSTSKTTAIQFIGTDTVGTAKETGDIYVTPADNNYVGSNMQFYTRGSDAAAERMRIDSSGNVGIGTTTPVAQLGVYGTGQTTAAMSTSTGLGGMLYARDSGSAANNGGAIMFGANQGAFATIKGLLQDGASNTRGDLAFSTRTSPTDATLTERMRIDSAGNVGIGTTAPVTKLNIVDALAGGQLLVATNQTDATEKYGTFGTQHYTNAEEPALGIAAQSNATDNIILVGGALSEFNAATQVRLYTAANNTTVTGTERMRITSAGGVSFGATGTAYGTSGQVLTSAGNAPPTWTTAASANTASAIVQRDGSGNFTAGTITATLTGTATGLAGSPNITTGTINGGNTQLNSLGINTAASGTAGEIRATNNITAYYSDDRFKTNLGNIPDALAKVLTLNGFYYEANELAQSYGYEKILEVGVSAQQVQAVQPEVVVPAPIDENYLTVRYERLVPLLIEAIKELNAKVATLEQTVAKSTQG